MYKITHMQRELRFAGVPRCSRRNQIKSNTRSYNIETREDTNINKNFSVHLLIQRTLYMTCASSPLLSASTQYTSNRKFPEHIMQETKSSELQRLHQEMHKNAFAQYIAEQNAPFTGSVSHTHSEELPQQSNINVNQNNNNNNYRKQFDISQGKNNIHAPNTSNKEYTSNKNTRHAMLTYEIKPTHYSHIPVKRSKKQEYSKYIESSVRHEHTNKDKEHRHSNNSENKSTHSTNTQTYKCNVNDKFDKEQYNNNWCDEEGGRTHITHNPSYTTSFPSSRYTEELETIRNLQDNVVVPHIAHHAKRHCFALLCKTIRIVHEVQEVLANIASKRYTERKANLEFNNNNKQNNESSKVLSLLDGGRRHDYEAIIRERVLQLQSTLREFIPLIDINNNNNNENMSLKINEVWVIDDIDVINIMKHKRNNNKNNSNENKSYNMNKEENLPVQASFTIKQLYHHLTRDLYRVYRMLSYNFSRYTQVTSFQYSHRSNAEASKAYIRTSGALYAIRALLYQLVNDDIQHALSMWCTSEIENSSNKVEQEEQYFMIKNKQQQHLYNNSRYYRKDNHINQRVECLTLIQTFKLFKMCIHIPIHELPLFNISNVSTIMQHVNFNKYCSFIHIDSDNSNYFEPQQEHNTQQSKDSNSNDNNDNGMKKKVEEEEIKYIFHAIMSKPFTCEEWLLLRLLMMPSSEWFSSSTSTRNNKINSIEDTLVKGKNFIEMQNGGNKKTKQVIWQHERQLFEILRICLTSSSSRRFDKMYDKTSKNYLASPSFVKQDQYSASKQSNREDLRIPFHLGAAFATKLMMSVLASDPNTTINYKKTHDADKTHQNNEYYGDNDNLTHVSKQEEGNRINVLQTLSINHIALLCSAILFYELYNIYSLKVLVASAPRFVEEVELLNGVEVSTVMMSFAKLNYSGEMVVTQNIHKIQNKEGKQIKSDNFYVVLGNHAARLGESLSATDISLILSSLEHVHIKHDLLRSCFEAMLRTRNVFY